MNRIKDFFRTFLLFELLKGMMLTGRYMFARKITIHFPEEKTPQSPRFRGLHALRRTPSCCAAPERVGPAQTAAHRSRQGLAPESFAGRWVRR